MGRRVLSELIKGCPDCWASHLMSVHVIDSSSTISSGIELCSIYLFLKTACHPYSLIFIGTLLAAAKLLQSCLTLCDPIDGSPPGSPVPGILQARTLEWVAISFFQCMKVKSESEVAQLCPTLRERMDLQPTRLLRPWDFPGKSTGVGCHRLLRWGHWYTLFSTHQIPVFPSPMR